MRLWRNGRRAALRSLWGQPRGGSNPLSRTIKLINIHFLAIIDPDQRPTIEAEAHRVANISKSDALNAKIQLASK